MLVDDGNIWSADEGTTRKAGLTPLRSSLPNRPYSAYASPRLSALTARPSRPSRTTPTPSQPASARTPATAFVRTAPESFRKKLIPLPNEHHTKPASTHTYVAQAGVREGAQLLHASKPVQAMLSREASPIAATSSKALQGEMRDRRYPRQGPSTNGTGGPIDVFDLIDDSEHSNEMFDSEEVPPTMVEAAAAFESRHQLLSRQAEIAMFALQRDLTSKTKVGMLQSLTEDVRRNRLFAKEHYNPYEISSSPRRREPCTPAANKTKWKLQDSCFAPRTRFGNTKVGAPQCEYVDQARHAVLTLSCLNPQDWWETVNGFEIMFDADWEMARKGHGLENWIFQSERQGPMRRRANLERFAAAPVRPRTERLRCPGSKRCSLVSRHLYLRFAETSTAARWHSL